MIALIGCTTPSSMYVGQDGKRIRCAAHGWGYMGVTMAQGIHDQCSADAKAAGLIPLAEAGIRPGDFIIAVDDQPVTNVADGRRMFFGRANTPVKVTYRSGGTDKTVNLIRYPVTSMQAATHAHNARSLIEAGFCVGTQIPSPPRLPTLGDMRQTVTRHEVRAQWRIDNTRARGSKNEEAGGSLIYNDFPAS
jgi:membrane-associated protease RseP (regulator of RpoE activity)